MILQKRFYRWFIFLFIAIQPIFDAITFWTVFKFGLPNFIIFIRVFLVLVLGFLALSRNRIKLTYLLISLIYFAFMLLLFFINNNGGLANRFAALVDGSKVFIMPITMLWIVWVACDDAEGIVRSAWFGVASSAVIIIAIVAISLVTGTHYPTYDQPWLNIGLNGWFYSGNGQSVILLATLPFLLSVLLKRSNIVMLPLGIVAAWILLFLNGTRIAYYGLLIVLACITGWMLYQKALKKMSFRIWVYAIFAAALVLAVVLYPLSTVKSLSKFKDSQLQFFTQKETSGGPISQAPLPNASTLADGQAGLSPAMQKQDSGEKYTIVKSFNDVISHWTTKQRMDVRYKQSEFVKISMEHATLYRWLFGYGSKWFSDNVGDLETDYFAVLGGYGIVGTIVFFLPVIWLLVGCVLNMWKNRKKSILTMATVIPGMVIIIMLGAAMLSGRAFQQPSVSIYLSLAIGLLYLILGHNLYQSVPISIHEGFESLHCNSDKNINPL